MWRCCPVGVWSSMPSRPPARSRVSLDVWLGAAASGPACRSCRRPSRLGGPGCPAASVNQPAPPCEDHGRHQRAGAGAGAGRSRPGHGLIPAAFIAMIGRDQRDWPARAGRRRCCAASPAECNRLYPQASTPPPLRSSIGNSQSRRGLVPLSPPIPCPAQPACNQLSCPTCSPHS